MKLWKKGIQSSYLTYIPLMSVLLFFFTDVAFAKPKFPEAFNSLMKEYNVIVEGVIGFGVASSILIFIVHMMRLASVGGDNPAERRKILNNIVISGITTALLGSVGLFVTILYTTVFY